MIGHNSEKRVRKFLDEQTGFQPRFIPDKDEVKYSTILRLQYVQS